MSNQTPRQKPPVTKQPVTIRLDIRVVDTFKHLAAKDDRGYQGMINKVLRDYVEALPDEDKYYDR